MSDSVSVNILWIGNLDWKGFVRGTFYLRYFLLQTLLVVKCRDRTLQYTYNQWFSRFFRTLFIWIKKSLNKLIPWETRVIVWNKGSLLIPFITYSSTLVTYVVVDGLPEKVPPSTSRVLNLFIYLLKRFEKLRSEFWFGYFSVVTGVTFILIDVQQK